jgi:dTDP-glucose 4,6-dehydratase
MDCIRIRNKSLAKRIIKSNCQNSQINLNLKCQFPSQTKAFTMYKASMTALNLRDLLGERKRILVTGGAGFIGGAVVRRLLLESDATVFNLDKMGYASDLTSIENTIATLATRGEGDGATRHQLLQVDLANAEATQKAIATADPDLVMHLAAESHVDRSIEGPGAFIESNLIGTFNLLQASRIHFNQLEGQRKVNFRFHHISTDEVFGSLGATGKFSETTPYDPRSPYSASKAASDHLVNAWYHTFGLPIILTNCSNNYGPWQYPEKLIPVVILKAAAGEAIPLYGDGMNIRDWLYVEDHVDALLLAANNGRIGENYCIGGHGERSNLQVIENICTILDRIKPEGSPHRNLITFVKDRLGHDRRYAINPEKITTELGWQPRHDFEDGLEETVKWYVNQKTQPHD